MWRARVQRDLKDQPFDEVRTLTPEGIAIEPVYGEDSGHVHTPARRGGRGASIPWEICTLVDTPDPTEAGATAAKDIACGATAIVIKTDKATRWSMDPDNPATPSAAYGQGTSIPSLDAMAQLLGHMEPGQARIHLDAGANAMVISAMCGKNFAGGLNDAANLPPPMWVTFSTVPEFVRTTRSVSVRF